MAPCRDIGKTAEFSIIADQETRWPVKDVLKSTHYTFYNSGEEIERGTKCLVNGRYRDAVYFDPAQRTQSTYTIPAREQFFKI